MTEYFDSRSWGEVGLSRRQIRYLDDLTRKLNTVETNATDGINDEDLEQVIQPAINTMTFLLMGA